MATSESREERLARLAAMQPTGRRNVRSAEELGRAEVARAARHFGFGQPAFRTSVKLRFSGDGVAGHDLRSDTAGIVIGGVSDVVEAAGQDSKVPKDSAQLFLSPTVLPGSTVLELFGPPLDPPAQEKLDTEIDDGPTDVALGRVFSLLDAMNLRSIGNASEADLGVSASLGNKLFALATSLIEAQVDLDLTWTRPRGSTREAVFSRATAHGFRSLLDVEQTVRRPRREFGIVSHISTDGTIGFTYGEKRDKRVTLDATGVEVERLRSLWATEVVLSWIEETTSHPRRRVPSQIERTVTAVEARTAPVDPHEAVPLDPPRD